jgi:crotonobetainyl-CoA:carnitine CoA-transferase CaiB-like acyl-CoA transferase
MRGRPVFAALNTGKRSITVNLESPEGRLIVLELARWAHVAVENFTPGVMERLGLGMEDFGAANHGLMVCSISSFGPPGPCHDWKATGFTLDAMAGLLPRGNTAGAPPGYHQAELAGGAAAAAAIETSRGSGTGPAVHHLEISVMDAARYRRQGRARSLTPSAAGPQAPALGQHNREVFLGLLGFSPGETVFLRQTGVI